MSFLTFHLFLVFLQRSEAEDGPGWDSEQFTQMPIEA